MDETSMYERLGNTLLDVIDEVGRSKVPPGMIGFVGELFTLSRMYYAFQEMKSKINYLGGRKPFDIEVGKKRIFVKTRLYGKTEKEAFGVDEGFLWPHLRVEKLSSKEGKLIMKKVRFDFVVLVGIRNKQPRFFVLTKDEFMNASYERGRERDKGTRLMALIEKIDDKKYDALTDTEKEYVNHFRQEDTVNLLKRSEGAWGKIRKALYR
jgi:hypothetical protein